MQANGMVDDRLDFSIPDDQRKDYWYVNHKLMQSGPEVHTYADSWGDIRGRTIFPNEKPRVYLNQGRKAAGHFVDVSAAVGIVKEDNSRGVLLADLDNDGDLDALLANQHGQADLYRNTLQSKTPRHFACVQPRGDGTHTHRSGLGVRGSIVVDGVTLHEEQTLMAGFSAQREPFLRFGLADRDAATVDVTLRWTGGSTETVAVPIDRCVVVEQGVGVVER
jgi:hypothetical protein